MTWATYKTIVRLSDLSGGPELEELAEALEDVADVERDGDDLLVTYEAGGNVEAVQHSYSILGELRDLEVEAAQVRLESQWVKNDDR